MMDEDSSSESSLDSEKPSEPCVPLITDTTTGVRCLSESNVHDLRDSRRQHGIINKIGTGIKKVVRRFSRTNTTLSQLDIQILATITHFNCNEVLQWHDKFLAECPHGYMTKKTFISMYQSLAPKGDGKRFARHIFRAFDRDKSDTIDFREFLIGLSMSSATTSPEMKLEWIFQVFDIDGNGLLTQGECLEVIDTIVRFNHSQFPAEKQSDIEDLIITAKKSILKLFDQTSADGSDTLSMTQFVEGCKHNELISKLLTPNSS